MSASQLPHLQISGGHGDSPMRGSSPRGSGSNTRYGTPLGGNSGSGTPRHGSSSSSLLYKNNGQRYSGARPEPLTHGQESASARSWKDQLRKFHEDNVPEDIIDIYIQARLQRNARSAAYRAARDAGFHFNKQSREHSPTGVHASSARRSSPKGGLLDHLDEEMQGALQKMVGKSFKHIHKATFVSSTPSQIMKSSTSSAAEAAASRGAAEHAKKGDMLVPSDLEYQSWTNQLSDPTMPAALAVDKLPQVRLDYKTEKPKWSIPCRRSRNDHWNIEADADVNVGGGKAAGKYKPKEGYSKLPGYRAPDGDGIGDFATSWELNTLLSSRQRNLGFREQQKYVEHIKQVESKRMLLMQQGQMTLDQLEHLEYNQQARFKAERLARKQTMSRNPVKARVDDEYLTGISVKRSADDGEGDDEYADHGFGGEEQKKRARQGRDGESRRGEGGKDFDYKVQQVNLMRKVAYLEDWARQQQKVLDHQNLTMQVLTERYQMKKDRLQVKEERYIEGKPDPRSGILNPPNYLKPTKGALLIRALEQEQKDATKPKLTYEQEQLLEEKWTKLLVSLTENKKIKVKTTTLEEQGPPPKKALSEAAWAAFLDRLNQTSKAREDHFTMSAEKEKKEKEDKRPKISKEEWQAMMSRLCSPPKKKMPLEEAAPVRVGDRLKLTYDEMLAMAERLSTFKGMPSNDDLKRPSMLAYNEQLKEAANAQAQLEQDLKRALVQTVGSRNMWLGLASNYSDETEEKRKADREERRKVVEERKKKEERKKRKAKKKRDEKRRRIFALKKLGSSGGPVPDIETFSKKKKKKAVAEDDDDDDDDDDVGSGSASSATGNSGAEDYDDGFDDMSS